MNPQPKQKTHRDKYYVDVWIRRQVCVACGRSAVSGILDVVPAHSGGGVAKKGPDKEALPLCVECHNREHRGDKTFWAEVAERTGKTREQYVEETWARYQEEVL